MKRRHPRDRESPEEQAWARIHSELVDLLADLQYIKSNKGFIKLMYGRSLSLLRSRLIKILNVIDSKNDYKWE